MFSSEKAVGDLVFPYEIQDGSIIRKKQTWFLVGDFFNDISFFKILINIDRHIFHAYLHLQRRAYLGSSK